MDLGDLDLSSIPLVGALFRDRETKFEQKELLIFITPRMRVVSSTPAGIRSRIVQ